MSDWHIGLIASDGGDNVIHGLILDRGRHLVHVHQDDGGQWVVRRLVGHVMVLHDRFCDFRNAIAAAEDICR